MDYQREINEKIRTKQYKTIQELKNIKLCKSQEEGEDLNDILVQIEVFQKSDLSKVSKNVKDFINNTPSLPAEYLFTLLKGVNENDKKEIKKQFIISKLKDIKYFCEQPTDNSINIIKNDSLEEDKKDYPNLAMPNDADVHNVVDGLNSAEKINDYINEQLVKKSKIMYMSFLAAHARIAKTGTFKDGNYTDHQKKQIFERYTKLIDIITDDKDNSIFDNEGIIKEYSNTVDAVYKSNSVSIFSSNKNQRVEQLTKDKNSALLKKKNQFFLKAIMEYDFCKKYQTHGMYNRVIEAKQGVLDSKESDFGCDILNLQRLLKSFDLDKLTLCNHSGQRFGGSVDNVESSKNECKGEEGDITHIKQTLSLFKKEAIARQAECYIMDNAEYTNITNVGYNTSFLSFEKKNDKNKDVYEKRKKIFLNFIRENCDYFAKHCKTSKYQNFALVCQKLKSLQGVGSIEEGYALLYNLQYEKSMQTKDFTGELIMKDCTPESLPYMLNFAEKSGNITNLKLHFNNKSGSILDGLENIENIVKISKFETLSIYKEGLSENDIQTIILKLYNVGIRNLTIRSATPEVENFEKYKDRYNKITDFMKLSRIKMLFNLEFYNEDPKVKEFKDNKFSGMAKIQANDVNQFSLINGSPKKEFKFSKSDVQFSEKEPTIMAEVGDIQRNVAQQQQQQQQQQQNNYNSITKDKLINRNNIKHKLRECLEFDVEEKDKNSMRECFNAIESSAEKHREDKDLWNLFTGDDKCLDRHINAMTPLAAKMLHLAEYNQLIHGSINFSNLPLGFEIVKLYGENTLNYNPKLILEQEHSDYKVFLSITPKLTLDIGKIKLDDSEKKILPQQQEVVKYMKALNPVNFDNFLSKSKSNKLNKFTKTFSSLIEKTHKDIRNEVACTLLEQNYLDEYSKLIQSDKEIEMFTSLCEDTIKDKKINFCFLIKPFNKFIQYLNSQGLKINDINFSYLTKSEDMRNILSRMYDILEKHKTKDKQFRQNLLNDLLNNEYDLTNNGCHSAICKDNFNFITPAMDLQPKKGEANYIVNIYEVVDMDSKILARLSAQDNSDCPYVDHICQELSNKNIRREIKPNLLTLLIKLNYTPPNQEDKNKIIHLITSLKDKDSNYIKELIKINDNHHINLNSVMNILRHFVDVNEVKKFEKFSRYDHWEYYEKYIERNPLIPSIDDIEGQNCETSTLKRVAMKRHVYNIIPGPLNVFSLKKFFVDKEIAVKVSHIPDDGVPERAQTWTRSDRLKYIICQLINGKFEDKYKKDFLALNDIWDNFFTQQGINITGDFMVAWIALYEKDKQLFLNLIPILKANNIKNLNDVGIFINTNKKYIDDKFDLNFLAKILNDPDLVGINFEALSDNFKILLFDTGVSMESKVSLLKYKNCFDGDGDVLKDIPFNLFKDIGVSEGDFKNNIIKELSAKIQSSKGVYGLEDVKKFMQALSKINLKKFDKNALGGIYKSLQQFYEGKNHNIVKYVDRYCKFDIKKQDELGRFHLCIDLLNKQSADDSNMDKTLDEVDRLYKLSQYIKSHIGKDLFGGIINEVKNFSKTNISLALNKINDIIQQNKRGLAFLNAFKIADIQINNPKCKYNLKGDLLQFQNDVEVYKNNRIDPKEESLNAKIAEMDNELSRKKEILKTLNQEIENKQNQLNQDTLNLQSERLKFPKLNESQKEYFENKLKSLEARKNDLEREKFKRDEIQKKFKDENDKLDKYKEFIPKIPNDKNILFNKIQAYHLLINGTNNIDVLGRLKDIDIDIFKLGLVGEEYEIKTLQGNALRDPEYEIKKKIEDLATKKCLCAILLIHRNLERSGFKSDSEKELFYKLNDFINLINLDDNKIWPIESEVREYQAKVSEIATTENAYHILAQAQKMYAAKFNYFIKKNPDDKSINLLEKQKSDFLENLPYLHGRDIGKASDLKNALLSDYVKFIIGNDEAFNAHIKQTFNEVNGKAYSFAHCTENELLSKIKGYSDIGDNIEKIEICLAILRELMFRQTGRFANATQIYSILTLILSPKSKNKNILAEISTGEGKTMISTLVLAMNAIIGKTPIYTSSTDALAKISLDEATPFLNSIGIDTKEVGLDGIDNFKTRTVYFAGVSNLYFAINGYELNGGLMPKDLSVLMDEIDALLFDNKAAFIKAIPKNSINEALMCRFINLFYKQKKQAIDNAIINNSIDDLKVQAKIFIEDVLQKQNPDVYKALKSNDELQNEITEYLNSAYLANKLILNKDFTIGYKYIEVTNSEGQRMMKLIKEIRIITGEGAEDKVSEWSKSVHNLLREKYSRDLEHGGLYHITNKTVGLTNGSLWHFFDTLQGKGVISGITGTLGGKDDLAILSKYFQLAAKVPTYNVSKRVNLGLSFVKDKDELYPKLKEVVNKSLNNPATQPTVILFKDLKELNDFIERSEIDKTKYNIITGGETSEELNKKLQIAGKPGTITLSTNFLGRGIDIKPEHPNGLHIVITFAAFERALIQMFGRAARQGKEGSYESILNRYDYIPYILAIEKYKDKKDQSEKMTLIERYPAEEEYTTMTHEQRKIKVDKILGDTSTDPEYIHSQISEFLSYQASKTIEAEIKKNNIPRIYLEKYKALKRYVFNNFKTGATTGYDLDTIFATFLTYYCIPNLDNPNLGNPNLIEKEFEKFYNAITKDFTSAQKQELQKEIANIRKFEKIPDNETTKRNEPLTRTKELPLVTGVVNHKDQIKYLKGNATNKINLEINSAKFECVYNIPQYEQPLEKFLINLGNVMKLGYNGLSFKGKKDSQGITVQINIKGLLIKATNLQEVKEKLANILNKGFIKEGQIKPDELLNEGIKAIQTVDGQTLYAITYYSVVPQDKCVSEEQAKGIWNSKGLEKVEKVPHVLECNSKFVIAERFSGNKTFVLTQEVKEEEVQGILSEINTEIMKNINHKDTDIVQIAIPTKDKVFSFYGTRRELKGLSKIESKIFDGVRNQLDLEQKKPLPGFDDLQKFREHEKLQTHQMIAMFIQKIHEYHTLKPDLMASLAPKSEDMSTLVKDNRVCSDMNSFKDALLASMRNYYNESDNDKYCKFTKSNNFTELKFRQEGHEEDAFVEAFVKRFNDNNEEFTMKHEYKNDYWVKLPPGLSQENKNKFLSQFNIIERIKIRDSEEVLINLNGHQERLKILNLIKGLDVIEKSKYGEKIKNIIIDFDSEHQEEPSNDEPPLTPSNDAPNQYQPNTNNQTNQFNQYQPNINNQTNQFNQYQPNTNNQTNQFNQYQYNTNNQTNQFNQYQYNQYNLNPKLSTTQKYEIKSIRDMLDQNSFGKMHDTWKKYAEEPKNKNKYFIKINHNIENGVNTEFTCIVSKNFYDGKIKNKSNDDILKAITSIYRKKKERFIEFHLIRINTLDDLIRRKSEDKTTHGNYSYRDNNLSAEFQKALGNSKEDGVEFYNKFDESKRMNPVRTGEAESLEIIMKMMKRVNIKNPNLPTYKGGLNP